LTKSQGVINDLSTYFFLTENTANIGLVILSGQTIGESAFRLPRIMGFDRSYNKC